jgi:hypothetical protein
MIKTIRINQFVINLTLKPCGRKQTGCRDPLDFFSAFSLPGWPCRIKRNGHTHHRSFPIPGINGEGASGGGHHFPHHAETEVRCCPRILSGRIEPLAIVTNDQVDLRF